tara:strand:- start:352 stop:573 length:222 start_codon:yes stop_codon:yes gene_type:complete
LIGDHLPSLDRQIEEKSGNIEQAQFQTKSMMEKVAERIEQLEKEIGSLNDNIREIEGIVFDVELVLECLPLGK